MFQNSQNPFTCGPSFGPFWSVKYLNFGQNLPIWTAHPTFLESEHPEVTKSLYYVFFLKASQKSISSWTISDHLTICDINLFACGHCFFQYEFMKVYIFYLLFWKTRSFSFRVLVLMFLYLWLLAFILLFYILNSMSFLIISGLITFFSFLLTSVKWSVKIWELCHAIYKKLFSSFIKKDLEMLQN